MARPYAQLSPFAIARGEATAGSGGGGGTIGSIPIDLASARYIDTNDIPDANSNAAGDSSGGLLALDTTPALERVNGATDKALRIMWVAGNTDEAQFAPVYMPPDLDATEDVTVHLLARMSGATDTPTIDVQVFDGIGDTEMGGVTAALSNTLAELTVTLTAADISGPPTGFFNITLTPGAHATDEVELYAAWIEYSSTSANAGSENVTGTGQWRDEKSSTSEGGTFTSGSWQTRTLQTEALNTITGASLASNQITLPAGTYEIDAYARAYRVGKHQAKLRDTTGAADLILGVPGVSQNASDYAECPSVIKGRFTLSVESDLEIQHRCATTQNTNGFGAGTADLGVTGVFCDVTIRKIST
jgi:hypothetical protein